MNTLTIINNLAALDDEGRAEIGALIATGQPLPAPLDTLTPYLPKVKVALDVFHFLLEIAKALEAALVSKA